MKIEVRGIYFTRNGRLVEITSSNDAHHMPTFRGAFIDMPTETNWWYEGGQWDQSGKDNQLDLVAVLPRGEFDMDKFVQKYVLAFRKSPTEKYRYENFGEKNVLYKKYKKTLKTSSFFKVFEKQEDGKYQTIYTKQTYVDKIVSDLTKLITSSGKAKEFYLALKKANENLAKELKA